MIWTFLRVMRHHAICVCSHHYNGQKRARNQKHPSSPLSFPVSVSLPFHSIPFHMLFCFLIILAGKFVYLKAMHTFMPIKIKNKRHRQKPYGISLACMITSPSNLFSTAQAIDYKLCLIVQSYVVLFLFEQLYTCLWRGHFPIISKQISLQHVSRHHFANLGE